MKPGPNYDPALPFVTRRALTFDGQAYAEGAPFPWRELGVSERQLWDLFRTMQIAQAPPAVAPAPPPSSKPKQRARAGA